MTITFSIVGGVSFLLFLQLWYWGMRVVHHDVCIIVIHEVPHIMVKQTNLGYFKCWPMWAVDEKLISILDVLGHKVIFLDQDEGKDVRNSLGVIPYRIGISGEVANFFGVCHSCVTTENTS